MSETESHEIIVAEVKDEIRTLIIKALKSKRAIGGDFLPTEIHLKGGNEPTWSFMELKALGFDGLAKLFRLESPKSSAISMIGLVDRSGRKLSSIIPLSSLGVSKLVNAEGFGFICMDEQYQPCELIILKIRLAKREGLKASLTSVEKNLLDDFYDAKRADEEAENVKRQEVKKERQKEILSREEIVVFEGSGKKLHGIPVVESEWEVLTNQYAILVADYDQESGQAGDPLEAFFVEKVRGGRPFKKGVKTGLVYELPKPEAVRVAVKIIRLNGQLASQWDTTSNKKIVAQK